jgi:hypothetical protein
MNSLATTVFDKVEKRKRRKKSWKGSTNLSPFAKSFLGCSHMTQHQNFENINIGPRNERR